MGYNGIPLGISMGFHYVRNGDTVGGRNATLPWTVETLEILGEICSINWCGFVLSTRWWYNDV